MSTYLLERALVGDLVHADVLVTVVDGRFAGVDTGANSDTAVVRGAAGPGKGGGPAGSGTSPGDAGNERGGGPWMGLAPVSYTHLTLPTICSV